jgi:hypothetical protein
MRTFPIRNAIALLVLASLPGLAAAAGSQAGDNGRQPVGADNEGPRMAIPGESTEAGQWQSYDSNGYYDPYRQPRVYVGDAPPAYYVAPPPQYYYYPAPQYHYYAPPGYYVSPYPPSATYYSYDEASRARALGDCDKLPLADRPACRDAVAYGR